MKMNKGRDMNTKIEKLTSVFKSKYLSTYKLDFMDKTGKAGEWYAVSRRNEKKYKENLNLDKKMLDAVLIVSYHVDLKKLIMIKQFRVPLNAYLYEIPAGLIDDCETPEESCKRELKEETGLDLIKIVDKKERIFSSCGLTDECFNMYFVTCNGEISDKFLTQAEEIEIIPVDQEDCKKIINSPDKKLDMKALYAMELFSILGEKLFEPKAD